MLNKEIIIRRLALIKYLFQKGVEMSKQAETTSGFSILSFHDSIEMFLILAAEDRDIKKYKTFSFMQFWDSIPELTMRNQIEALKDRRVAIKHRCQFPSKQDVEISRINTIDFFIENTSKIFNLKFSDISLADLISSQEVRELIISAEKKLADNDIYGSLCDSRYAFTKLFVQYESSKNRFEHWDSLLDIGKEIGDDYKRLVGTDNKNGARWFEQVSLTTNQLRDILKYTALGLDFRKYVYFDTVAPKVFFYYSKEESGIEAHFEEQEYYEYEKNLRAENADFCIGFVIDCSLKLQEFDFDRSQIFKSREESEVWIQSHRSQS